MVYLSFTHHGLSPARGTTEVLGNPYRPSWDWPQVTQFNPDKKKPADYYAQYSLVMPHPATDYDMAAGFMARTCVKRRDYMAGQEA